MQEAVSITLAMQCPVQTGKLNQNRIRHPEQLGLVMSVFQISGESWYSFPTGLPSSIHTVAAYLENAKYVKLCRRCWSWWWGNPSPIFSTTRFFLVYTFSQFLHAYWGSACHKTEQTSFELRYIFNSVPPQSNFVFHHRSVDTWYNRRK